MSEKSGKIRLFPYLLFFLFAIFLSAIIGLTLEYFKTSRASMDSRSPLF